MAVFTDLHDVAQVLSEHIRHEVGVVDVQPGPPENASAGARAGVRLTLLYTTPQPTHGSDPEERQPDGSRRPPPLSLSCFYLVTTSGADADDPVAAHFALGRIMTLYHDQPVLSLPLSDQPDAPDSYSELGEGPLAVMQVPMSLELIDKVWTSVDIEVQPWTLVEVAPVQLRSLLEDTGPAPVVRPGGIGLDVRAGTRPVVLRVTPEPARPGGRVRVDVHLQGTLETVMVAGVTVPAADDDVAVAADGSHVMLALDDALSGLGEGAHQLTVLAAGLVSRRAVLRVGAAAAAAVDAPEAAHDRSDDLVLEGAGLADAQEVVLWPDTGLTSPSDVFAIEPSAAAAGEVTVPSDGDPGLEDLSPGTWRATVRIGEQVYTPYVLVELTA